MPKLTTKTRITLTQVSLASAVIMIGLSLGLIPDHQHDVQAERESLCESLAWSVTSMVVQDQLPHVEQLLAFTVDRAVDRNGALKSAALVRGTELLAEAGPHRGHWPEHIRTHSRDGFVVIDIAKSEREPGWGRLQLRFEPMMAEGWLMVVLTHPWTRFGAFVSAMTFVAFRWYLGRVFNHLDPQKAVPQRVRSAYDFLTGGLVALDSSQRIVLANKAFAEITRQPREALLGLKLSAVEAFRDIRSEDPTALPWLQVHQTKKPHLGTTLKLAGDREKPLSLMVNAAPVIGQDGEYRGVLVGFDDVTPLEEAKVALEKSKQIAEEANLAKSAFLANMSHEIRTPMNSILGFADVMRRGFADSEEERHEYLNIIHTSGQHLLDLINDILDLSKVESGKMELERIPCQPHTIVNDAMAIFSVRANEKNLSLDFRIEETIPELIRADPLRLRQVLTNLIGNAIKFTDSGSVTIVARLDHQDGLKLAFDVIDSGIGITAEEAQKIFDPFSQADSSTTRKFGGTGLGLPISRKLAEMMGGTIVAGGEAGKGSRFTVTIDPGPLDDVRMISQDDIATIVNTISNPSEEDYQLPAGKILVVDDGDSNRRLIQLVLERAGAKVTTAVNGADAVAVACQEPFDVILMDLMMPVMDGYEATGRLRDRDMNVPIIALTAHAMKEQRQQALDSGFDDFVSKPVNIDLLLEVVAKHLGGELKRRTKPVAGNATTLPLSPLRPEFPQEAPDRVLCALPMDDAEFIEIAREFTARLDEQLGSMALHWAAGEYPQLAQKAHWLKGAGGTAGFEQLTDPAKQLELAAKARDEEQCERWLDHLQGMAAAIWLPPQDSAAADDHAAADDLHVDEDRQSPHQPLQTHQV